MYFEKLTKKESQESVLLNSLVIFVCEPTIILAKISLIEFVIFLLI